MPARAAPRIPHEIRSLLWRRSAIDAALRGFDEARHMRIYAYSQEDRKGGDIVSVDIPLAGQDWTAVGVLVGNILRRQRAQVDAALNPASA